MARITIKEIAQQSGVSIATVSRVLNKSGYVSEEVRKKVLSVSQSLNYLPNAIAISLKKEKTNTIGVLIPDITNSYFMKISKGIEEAIHEHGYTLIFGSGSEDPQKEREVLKVLFEKRVDAIVLATSGGNEDIIKNITGNGIPVVLIDRKLNEESKNLDWIVEDNIDSAYELTKHLIDLGHTRIGVINGSLKVSTGRERYNGYKKAIEEKGINEDPALIFFGGFVESDGERAINQFLQLSSKPTAVISFNNTMTFGAILQLMKNGYRVPKDIMVASHGEVEAAKLLEPPGIIYTNQVPYNMGKRAGEILIDRLVNSIEGPIQETLKSSIECQRK